MEEWRDVPGCDGKYQISISTKEGKCKSTKTGRLLSNRASKRDGRIYWHLNEYQQAARWIALTYPELVQNERFEGAHIDHIDTDRLNNHPSNLRWVTNKENCNNPLTKKHMSEAKKGVFLNRTNQSKWVIKLSLNNEILHFYPSLSEAARDTGVKVQNISKCCQGKYKQSGGFIWKYSA